MLISPVCTSKQLQLRKMTDSLNFGPEWIRNLSSDGNITTSGGGTKYQLADYRYGREEMLALFEKGLKAPEPLTSFSTLYVEQCQLPLALIPMTEDENRLWQSRPAPPVASRGRGGSLERGRGRGRGATFHQGYSRSSSGYDDPVRSYERSQSGWPERNGVSESGEWTGVGSSPRKELGSSRSIGSSMENWRRHRIEEDSDGWRTTTNHRSVDKWSRSSSWREGDPSEERFERSIIADRSNRTSWHTGDGTHLSRGGGVRRPWETSSDDHLPEWATENLQESGGSGSFDSSGAFHGSNTEDESNLNKSVQKSASHQNLPHSNKVSSIHTSQSSHCLNSKTTSEKSTENAETKLREESERQLSKIGSISTTSSDDIKEIPPSTLRSKEKEKKDIIKQSNNESISSNNKSTSDSIPQKSPEKSGESKNFTLNSSEQEKSKLAEKITNNNNVELEPQKSSNINNNNNNSLSAEKSKSSIESSVKKTEDDFDRMQEVADDLVAKLMLDEETPTSKNNDFSNMNSIQSNEAMKSSQSAFNQFQTNLLQNSVLNSTLLGSQQSLAPGQDKWFYRDPQGDLQGPFLASDMTEWYRAGYFSVNLLLKRQCDERFFTLGELVKLCGNSGNGPFASSVRLPPVKTIDPSTLIGKTSGGLDSETLQRLQQMQLQQTWQQQLFVRQAMALQALSQTEPWATLSSLQQRELIAQHILAQPPILSDTSYLNPLAGSPVPSNNPLMQMINQMQQANKIPTQTPPPMNEAKPPNSISNQKQLDPIQQLIQQMGGIQQPHSATSVPPPGSQVPLSGLSMPGTTTTDHINHTQPTSENDPIKNFLRQFSSQQSTQHLPQTPQQQPPVDSFWSQGSFPNTNQSSSWLPTPAPTPSNINTPVSLWGDIRSNNIPSSRPPPPHQTQPDNSVTNIISKSEDELKQNIKHQQPQEQQLPPHYEHQNQQNEKEIIQKREEDEKKKLKKQEEERKRQEKREALEKEKRKKEEEQQERLRQKEAEEKRKEEQRKQEAERKAQEEKQKREAEKIRKELEKAKREADEKRLKVLEEKRKLKEQKKAEEEARKKAEEEKRKALEEEKNKEQERKAQEEQARRQQEALRKMQETQQQQRARVAPWYQANVPGGSVGGSAGGPQTKTLTLAEIQKAEKERRAAELALQQQQAKAQALKDAQELQASTEKSTMQLKWASKVAIVPKKVKSLAEIQAEEQERLAKQAAEARLAQLEKKIKEKKENNPTQSAGIWESASQSLTWGQSSTAGFWDDSSSVQNKVSSKISAAVVTKSSSAISINQNSIKIAPQQNSKSSNNLVGKNKIKPIVNKQDDPNVLKLFDSNGMELGNEFSSWCTKTLTALNSDVHIPTFIGFLMDIESPYEVKDYVRTYLGDGNVPNDFARQFLERRSKAKQRNRAALLHNDDMCVPSTPTVNPSNNTEFQEVKRKSKKVKKSRMTKVDSRILGFSVTAAQDRINVGDRDYGDNA